jgi:uncharacterized coiled-coil DUF342 family protein
MAYKVYKDEYDPFDFYDPDEGIIFETPKEKALTEDEFHRMENSWRDQVRIVEKRLADTKQKLTFQTEDARLLRTQLKDEQNRAQKAENRLGTIKNALTIQINALSDEPFDGTPESAAGRLILISGDLQERLGEATLTLDEMNAEFSKMEDEAEEARITRDVEHKRANQLQERVRQLQGQIKAMRQSKKRKHS